MNHIIVTADSLIETMNCLQYPLFEDNRKDYNLNLIGIRNSNPTPNKFDDLFCILWHSKSGWILNQYPCTTDPGIYWLENPLSKLGTAILTLGHHSGMWMKGYHKGYAALQQKAPVTVIRDYNKDNKPDYDGGRKETGLFGINGHRATAKGKSIQIDKWSAGCQVLAESDDFDEAMDIVDKAVENWGNSFSYTLLESSQLHHGISAN